MKIYITHSTSFDFKQDLYLPLRNSRFNNLHEIILPHETSTLINSKEIIKSSDLILAEVSFPSTGQGIELGWANSFGKNIVCIYKSGNKYSSSLKTVSDKFIEYTSPSDLIEKLINEKF